MIELVLIGLLVLFVFVPGVVTGALVIRRVRRWMR